MKSGYLPLRSGVVYRVWGVLVGMAAVVVFAIAGYLVVQKTPVAQAGQTPGYSSDTTPADPSSQPVTSGSGSVSPSTPGSASTSTAKTRITVAYLGDDYTLGTGASSPAKRFTTLMSATLKVHEANFGIDGAGYAKANSAGLTYESKVAAVAASDPAVIVVSGGRNARADDSDTFATAATTLFADLHSKAPKAVLVAVAPMWGDSPAPDAITALSDPIKSAVTAVGGKYLDIADPLLGHSEYMKDDADPDDQGYAAIASAVTAAIRPDLPKA